MKTKTVVLDVLSGTYSAIQHKDMQRWVNVNGSTKNSLDLGVTFENKISFSKAPGVMQTLLIRRKIRELIRRKNFFDIYKAAHSESRKPNRRSVDTNSLEVRNAVKHLKLSDLLYKTNDPSFDCLERSFTLYFTLCMQNVACWHRIGVTDIPFQAHAWAGIGNEPIIDEKSQLAKFEVISTI